MTRIEYYNLLVETSAKGGFPSVKDEFDCMYRGPDGRKCAVGLLIPDEKYSLRIEGHACNLSEVRDLIDFPDGMTVEDLQRAQWCHDWMARLDPWDHEAFVKSLEWLKS